MKFTLPPGMAEATRLTREGKLQDAMAMLRRGFQAEAPEPARPQPRSGPRPAPTGRIFDVEPEAAEPVGRAGFMEQLKRSLHRAAPAAPLPMPEGARFLDASFSGPGGSRTYKLYIPSTLPAGPVPLIVMLHGCTQSPDDFAAGTRMNALAEADPCLVAYPAQAASANAQRCWNWFNPEDQQRDRGEPAIIAGITRQILRDHAVDPRRVHVAGLSAGGAQAAIMGATYPELFAAIGVHSGLACGAARDMPSAFAAMRGGAAGLASAGRAVPTIVFHADRDPTVHPVNGDQVIAQARSATSLRAETLRGQVPGGHAYTRTRHADSAGHAVLEQWVVHGGGHAWSGGDPAGSYTDPKGPDASAEMRRFFAENPLPAA
jgi:poly(hydroxyalkanoate) depolymerase family esterase